MYKETTIISGVLQLEPAAKSRFMLSHVISHRPRKKCCLLLFLAVLLHISYSAVCAEVVEPAIYVRGSDKITRLDLDGDNMEVVIASNARGGIAADYSTQSLYWMGKDLTLNKSSLDGSSTVVLMEERRWTWIDVNAADNRIFISQFGSMYSCWLDGSNLSEPLISVNSIVGIDFNEINNRVYFPNADAGADDEVFAMDPDGSNTTRLIEHLVRPEGIAVDPLGQKMYFTLEGPDAIARANLDGSDFEIIVQDPPGYQPQDIELGPDRQTVYWIEEQGRLYRCNLDGTNVEQIAQVPFGRQFSILVPEPATLGLFLIGGLALLRRCRV